MQKNKDKIEKLTFYIVFISKKKRWIESKKHNFNPTKLRLTNLDKNINEGEYV